MKSSIKSEVNNSVPVVPLPESDRTKLVQEAFRTNFLKKPDFYIRVPGRVNLIGEHIDYCGYGVCPMALAQDILLAVSVEDDKKLHLHNLEAKFVNFESDIKNFKIAVEGGAPQWYEYFLCGLKGILEILPKNTTLKGMKVVVSGTIPQSAGLSSSSALVSAAALATAYAHDLAITKDKMASLCAECEKYIGTQGGGMDQAIAFLASEGCAKYIQFNPLRSSDIVLPKGAVFVIAHSLAELNKAATSDFNCRVVECRLAAQIIGAKNGLKWENVRKLGDLQEALKLDLTEMIILVEKTLHIESYTKEEVAQELGTSVEYLENASLTPNTKHINSFKLKQRSLHVFQEALRVEKFHETCSAAASQGQGQGDETTLETLGQLMSQSHTSLRDLYECSHPQLDRLIEMSKGLTLGARLTGAGWGGCVVALVQPQNVSKYISTLREKYYKEFGLENLDLDKVVFATSPNAGASILMQK